MRKKRVDLHKKNHACKAENIKNDKARNNFIKCFSTKIGTIGLGEGEGLGDVSTFPLLLVG